MKDRVARTARQGERHKVLTRSSDRLFRANAPRSLSLKDLFLPVTDCQSHCFQPCSGSTSFVNQRILFSYPSSLNIARGSRPRCSMIQEFCLIPFRTSSRFTCVVQCCLVASSLGLCCVNWQGQARQGWDRCNSRWRLLLEDRLADHSSVSSPPPVWFCCYANMIFDSTVIDYGPSGLARAQPPAVSFEHKFGNVY